MGANIFDQVDQHFEREEEDQREALMRQNMESLAKSQSRAAQHQETDEEDENVPNKNSLRKLFNNVDLSDGENAHNPQNQIQNPNNDLDEEEDDEREELMDIKPHQSLPQAHQNPNEES